MKKEIVAGTFCLFTLWLSGCGTAPEKPVTEARTVDNQQTSATQLLKQAMATPSPQRERLMLDAAAAYAAAGETEQARFVIQQLTPMLSFLAAGEQQRLAELALKIELQRGQPENALFWADHLMQLPIHDQPLDAQISLLTQLSDVYELTGQNLAAAKVLSQLAGLQELESLTPLAQRIWQHLSAVPAANLERALEEEADTTSEWYGWLELAMGQKQALGRLEQQRDALERWQSLWPGHLAALYPPEELRLLANFEEASPKNILIALPQSGRLANAGRAIRDGMIAAWYALPESARPQVLFRDTERTDPGTLRAELETLEVDVIIGPLDKPRVRQWLEADLPTPMLPLNDPDTEFLTASGPHYYFGLSGQDELTQIARHLSRLGKRRIALIYPETDWAREGVERFHRQSASNGIQIVSSRSYGPTSELSTRVGELVGTAESRQRGRRLQDTLGELLDFRLRARQDLDAVVMIASPVAGRQIKPLLAFHYAGHLPVYATSLVYAGAENPEKDKDLNGVRFPEMPWTLTRAHPVKVALQVEGLNPAYQRLYALGVDALEVARRLPFLQAFDAFELDGVTGRIFKAGPDRLSREMQWARFDGGRVYPETGATP